MFNNMMINEGRATSLNAKLEYVYIFKFNCCDFVMVADGVDLDLNFEDEVVSKNNTKLFIGFLFFLRRDSLFGIYFCFNPYVTGHGALLG